MASKKKLIVPIFIIFLMVFGTFGVILGGFSNDNVETIEYHGYDFRYDGQRWFTFIDKDRVDFLFDPRELESIYIGGLFDKIINHGKIYLSYEPKDGLEQEIQYEAMGLPKKAGKFIDVSIYGLGVSSMSISVSSLIYGAITRDSEFLALGTSFLNRGLGVFFWGTGDYLDKFDMGEPPKKPKKKPISERIKDKIGGLLPQPTPEPVPVKVYSGIENYALTQPNK